MKQPQFIHLRTHSDYSMIDGLAKVKNLVQRATQQSMPALALTDQMNLCGLVKFYQSCHSSGIKPIIGTDIWLVEQSDSNQHYRLTLLAMDAVGYKHLKLLVSNAYQRGYRLGRPVVEPNSFPLLDK